MSQVIKHISPLCQILKPRLCERLVTAGIKKWVRPALYDLRSRKIREEEKFPKPPTPRSAFVDWNYNSELFALQKRISEDLNESLLRQCLTDHSFVVKERKKQEEVGIDASQVDLKDNRFLADEGLSIIRLHAKNVLSRELSRFPSDGIEALCDYLTKENVLAYISLHMGMKELILCEEYPPSDSTLSKVFQAFVAVVDKSSNSTRTERFVCDFIITQLCGKDVNEIWDISHPWRMLMEIYKAKGEESLEPRILRESGKNTILSVFVIGLYTSDKRLVATGIGETVEIAQEMAARDALKGIFGTKLPLPPFQFQSQPFEPYNKRSKTSQQEQRVLDSVSR